MGFEVQLNPRGLRDAYLHGLNRSFGDWGDESVYSWAFERDAGAGTADLMLLRQGGVIIAGSAVTYRRIRYEGREEVAGIMTGSWTLPEARGRGAFSRVIEETKHVVTDRGGSMLAAFVSRDNASRRRLLAAGCVEVPTWYLPSRVDTPRPQNPRAVEVDEATPAELHHAHERWQRQGTGAYVVYPTLDVWSSQYLNRPLPVERVIAAGHRCLIERAARADRIMWIDGGDPTQAIAALLSRAIAARRQLFVFTSEPHVADAAASLGLAPTLGSLTLLSLASEANGSPRDRLPDAWRLHGGDRA